MKHYEAIYTTLLSLKHKKEMMNHPHLHLDVLEEKNHYIIEKSDEYI